MPEGNLPTHLAGAAARREAPVAKFSDIVQQLLPPEPEANELEVLRARVAELEAGLSQWQKESQKWFEKATERRARLAKLDEMLASEEVPEGLVSTVAEEVTPDTAAEAAWRWFREQLVAPAYVGVDTGSSPGFTVERAATTPPVEPEGDGEGLSLAEKHDEAMKAAGATVERKRIGKALLELADEWEADAVLENEFNGRHFANEHARFLRNVVKEFDAERGVKDGIS